MMDDWKKYVYYKTKRLRCLLAARAATEAPAKPAPETGGAPRWRRRNGDEARGGT